MTRIKRPNILIFFTDQQRWDTCGCYGQELPTTPELDQMAQEGTLFTNAFTCQPVCGPARACIQTGMYATRNQCVTNGVSINPDHETIGQKLQQQGYTTGYIGKWHLGSNHSKTSRDLGRPKEVNGLLPVPEKYRKGYDYWLAADTLEFSSTGLAGGFMYDKTGKKVEFGGYRVDKQTDYVLDYLNKYSDNSLKEKKNAEDPFFLMVSYLEPHHQNTTARYEGPEGEAEKWKQYKHPGDLRVKGGDWQTSYPDYLACVNSLDKNLGRIRAKLKEKGLDKNTIVLFTSDHGCHFRTRNQEYKRSCHESSIRIPFVAYGPGFEGGGTKDELVSLIDLPATIVGAGGGDINGLDGENLLELGKRKSEWRDSVFVQISEHECGRAIRTKKWKYGVVSPELEGWEQGEAPRYVETYLYDLEKDPHELNNLVTKPELAPWRELLKAELLMHIREVEGTKPEIISAMDAIQEGCFPLINKPLEVHLSERSN